MPKKRKSTTAQAAKRKVGAPADTSKEHTGTVIHSCLWGVCVTNRGAYRYSSTLMFVVCVTTQRSTQRYSSTLMFVGCTVRNVGIFTFNLEGY